MSTIFEEGEGEGEKEEYDSEAEDEDARWAVERVKLYLKYTQSRCDGRESTGWINRVFGGL